MHTIKVKSLIVDPGLNTLQEQPGNKKNIVGDIVHQQLTAISYIYIDKGRYREDDETPHPLYNEEEKFYKRNFFLTHKNSYIYSLSLFSNNDNVKRRYIALTWTQNQKFLFMQNRHWIQQKDNIMWLVNVIVAFLAIMATIKSKN